MKTRWPFIVLLVVTLVAAFVARRHDTQQKTTTAGLRIETRPAEAEPKIEAAKALNTLPTESDEPLAIVVASTLRSEVQPGEHISPVPLDILFSQANLAYQLKEYEQSQKLVEQHFKRSPAATREVAAVSLIEIGIPTPAEAPLNIADRPAVGVPPSATIPTTPLDSGGGSVSCK